MPKVGLGLEGPARRIAFAGALIVALLVLAVGTTIVFYSSAVTKAQGATEHEREVSLALSGKGSLLARVALFARNAALSPAQLNDLKEERAAFRRNFETEIPRTSSFDQQDREALPSILAANNRAVASAERLRPLLGTAQAQALISTYSAQVLAVSLAIDPFVAANQLQAEQVPVRPTLKPERRGWPESLPACSRYCSPSRCSSTSCACCVACSTASGRRQGP
jgi:hypothetical protein